jgi:hypothetical protein
MVTHLRQLDLDDLGAELAEQRRRERRRDERADVEHPNTVERAWAGGPGHGSAPQL